MNKFYITFVLLFLLSAPLRAEIVSVPEFPQFKYDRSLLLQLGAIQDLDEMTQFVRAQGIHVVVVPSDKKIAATSSDPLARYFTLDKISDGFHIHLTPENRILYEDDAKKHGVDSLLDQVKEDTLIVIREDVDERLSLLHEFAHHLLGVTRKTSRTSIYDSKTLSNFILNQEAISNAFEDELAEEHAINLLLYQNAKALRLNDVDRKSLVYILSTDASTRFELAQANLDDWFSQMPSATDKEKIDAKASQINIFNHWNEAKNRYTSLFLNWIQLDPQMQQLHHQNKRDFHKKLYFHNVAISIFLTTLYNGVFYYANSKIPGSEVLVSFMLSVAAPIIPVLRTKFPQDFFKINPKYKPGLIATAISISCTEALKLMGSGL